MTTWIYWLKDLFRAKLIWPLRLFSFSHLLIIWLILWWFAHWVVVKMSPKINSVLPIGPIECSANANDQYFTKLTFRIQFVRGLFIVHHFLVVSQLQATNLKKLPLSSPGPRRAAKTLIISKWLQQNCCVSINVIVKNWLFRFMDEKRFC